MRKRKWQTLLYILLIIVFSYFYLLFNQLYFSAEDVFYVCERGLRSGHFTPEIKEVTKPFITAPNIE